MTRVLDLDAAVTGGYLDTATDIIASLIPDPTTLVDLGSGTGTGTIALARRFPRARVIALDNSAELLARVADNAAAAGVGTRIETRHADLSAALPAGLTDIDVAWASSTLHHFADADALLRSTCTALRPGGLLAAIEIDNAPTFLPADAPEHLLERRLRAAMTANGWNAHPDWGPAITAAGFDLAETRVIDADPTVGDDVLAEYAVAWYTHLRSGLSHALSADDRTDLDDLLTSLPHRHDLMVTARRIAWIARRPS